MKTESVVLRRIYKIINSTAILESLDGGGIYLKKRPSDSNLIDIVINNLPIQSGDTQSIIVFINVYAENFPKTGLPNYKRLDGTTRFIMQVLEEYKNNYNLHTEEFLSLEIIDQGVMNDSERKNTSYSSIRLQCYIEE